MPNVDSFEVIAQSILLILHKQEANAWSSEYLLTDGRLDRNEHLEI